MVVTPARPCLGADRVRVNGLVDSARRAHRSAVAAGAREQPADVIVMVRRHHLPPLHVPARRLLQSFGWLPIPARRRAGIGHGWTAQ